MAIALVAGACEDTSLGPGGSICCADPNPPPPLAPGNISRFAYAANATDNTLSAFLVDAVTGRLTPIGYVLTGTAPVAAATDPASKYLYVANRDDDTVSAFVIDEHSGTLLEMASSPYTVGDGPAALLVAPNGNALYVANRAGPSISVFTINSADGTLTPSGTTPTPGRSPTSLAINATNSVLFVGNSEVVANPASVSSFAIDAVTGVLSALDDVLVGNGALSIALHPSGNFLYAVSDTAGAVDLVTINTGNLAVPGPPLVTVGAGGSDIAIAPGGTSAYVTNRLANTVQDYSVNPATGAMAVISTPALDTGTAPVKITLDPVEAHVYVANATSADVSVFSIAAGTGALTAASTTRAQRGPQSLAMVTRGSAATAKARYAFILNQSAATISSYDVNATTGALTANGPQSLASGLSTPRAMAVDPFARFVYVAHASNEISAYRINAANGGLPSVATVTPGLNPSVTISVDPTAITVEASGRYAYAAGSAGLGWQVVVLAIDQTTGELTEVPSSGIDTGTQPVAIVNDPTGRFLYVVNSTSNDVSMFAIDTATGLLIEVGPAVGVDADPRSLTVDPSGRFAYVVSAGTNQIQAFLIDATDGGLAAAVPPSEPTGDTPEAVAADPTGRFVYAANANANNITPYSIDIEDVVDASMGELTAGIVSGLTGTRPTALAAEPGGKFLYVTNEVSNSLATFSINQTTGDLTRVTTAGASIPSGTFSTPIAIGLARLIE